MDDPDCWQEYSSSHFLVSTLLCVGIAVSYLPQHHRIVSLASSRGLSPTYLFLMSCSSFSTLINAVILQFPYLGCCTRTTFGQCAANLSSLIQLTLQWSMVFTTFILYYRFFPEEEKYSDDVRSPSWRRSVQVAWAVTAYMATVMAISFISLIFLVPNSFLLVGWAGLLGTASLVMSILQFLPQISSTWRRGHVGALSITSMSIQTPGSFIFAHSIAKSPGTNVTTWMPYFAGGCLQGTLLCICLYMRRKHGHTNEHRFIAVPQSPNYDEKDQYRT